MAKVKTVFFLPIKDNDGRDLLPDIEQTRQELYARFQGWTFAGLVQGTFQMPDGTMALDVSQVYYVVLDELQLSELEQILRDFKIKTTQEALYLEIHHQVEVRFV